MMKTARLAAFALVALAAAPVAAQAPGADVDYPPPPPNGQPDVIVITPAPTTQPVVQPQMAPVLPATLPPMTNNWSEVSHINGQVVPVGQRGDYLWKNKKTNIASNPIGWMVGFYGLSISHAISGNVAIRGDVNLIDIRDSDTRGYEVGASVPIYFRRVYSGPFLEPGIIVRNFEDSNDFCDFDCGSSSNPASIGPSVVFGWHWNFDSGLNVAAAFGIMRNINAKQMDEWDSDSDVEPSGYFRIGYAF